ncbi:MAG: flagellar basal body-associated protein FliL [Bacillota bacterium]
MKGVSLPSLAVIIVVIIAVLGVTATVSYLVATKVAVPNDQATAQPVNSAVVLKKDLGEFLTDLADQSTRRFVKAKVVIGYPEVKIKKFLSEKKDPSLEEELAAKDTEIKDLVFSVLRSKTADELKGEKVERVKQEIVTRINALLTSGKILAVYFSDIVIQ